MSLIESYIGMLYIQSLQQSQTDTIEKRELINLCVNRVKAYQRVNQLFSQLDDSDNQQNKYSPKNLADVIKIYNEFKCFNEDKDEFWISENSAHFFLEIVYAESEEKINEFIKFQLQLFKTRLQVIVGDDMDRIVKMCRAILGGQIQQITQQEWNQKGRQYILGTGKPQLKKFINVKVFQEFYKIQFCNVLYSVSHLSTYLEKGWAIIHFDELKKCLSDIFISKMKKRMQSIAQKAYYEELKENEQIQEIAKKILSSDSGQLGKQFTPLNQDELICTTVRQQSILYFPLCMEYLIDRLEENHHLKHSGRQQIQLFLKSAGMKVVEAIKYMRSQFQQKVSESDFDKTYLYNIRHNYGLEGKRENYQCYSCSYNLKQIPGTEEYHGCPYKNFSNENLQKYLKIKKYEQTDIDNVLALKQGNHFQKACSLLWHVKNQGSDSNLIIDNPVIFYKESLVHHKKIKLTVEQDQTNGQK